MLGVEATEREVATAVAARTEALVSGDAEAMRRILADEFTYTNASGATCDRDEYYVRCDARWQCVAGQTTARQS